MTSFFSAQLVSAQRLSALFPLRKFCPVANLNFKCSAWLVFLEFLCDKNRYYESVRVFISIFQALWKIFTFWKNKFFFLKNPATDFQNRGIHRRTAYIIACLHTHLVFFCFPIFSTAFGKVCGGNI